jgi:hypothetical protein
VDFLNHKVLNDAASYSEDKDSPQESMDFQASDEEERGDGEQDNEDEGEDSYNMETGKILFIIGWKFIMTCDTSPPTIVYTTRYYCHTSLYMQLALTYCYRKSIRGYWNNRNRQQVCYTN